MTAQIITSLGILCDIIGAVLVANEVVRVFRGPTTIDVGGAGYWDGSFIPKPNPEFEAHEQKKRRIMVQIGTFYFFETARLALTE